MKITIDATYFIDKDSLCYALKEVTGRTTKEGEDVYATHGYFNSLEAALNKLRHIRVQAKAKNEEMTITEYLKELSYETDRMKEILVGVDDGSLIED